MKKLITLLYLFCTCFVYYSCNKNKSDNIYCQGACPNNMVCINGSCQCPSSNYKLVNNICYQKTTATTGPKQLGYYFPVDSNKCWGYNTYFLFNDLDLKYIKYMDTNSTAFFGDQQYTIGQIGVVNEITDGGFYFIGNDSLTRFRGIKINIFSGPCKNSYPINENYVRMDGTFTKNYDFVNMRYIYSCHNGQILDTCYCKFYLL